MLWGREGLCREGNTTDCNALSSPKSMFNKPRKYMNELLSLIQPIMEPGWALTVYENKPFQCLCKRSHSKQGWDTLWWNAHSPNWVHPSSVPIIKALFCLFLFSSTRDEEYTANTAADFWLGKETEEKGAGENCLGDGNAPSGVGVAVYTDVYPCQNSWNCMCTYDCVC